MGSTHEFPVPVGGVPYPLDFAPSILFAVLYGLMVPVVVYRMVHPRSRNGVLIGTTVFSIERVVAFGLRAHVAHSASARANEGLETYFQTTYSGGFTSIGGDLMNLLRALLVSSTLGGDMVTLHSLTPPLVWEAQAAKDKEGKSDVELVVRKAQDDEEGDVDAGSGTPGSELVDQPELRQKIRQWCGLASLLSLAGVIMSIVAGSNYKNAVDGSHGDLVRSLWYASTVLGVVLLLGMAVTAVFALYKMPRVPRASLLWIILVAILLSIIGVYRMVVISHSTMSLFSTAPGSQNSAGSKAAFYALHVAPEFVSAAILMVLNARRMFGTGPWGDRLGKDPKPKPKPEPGSEGELDATKAAAKPKRGWWGGRGGRGSGRGRGRGS
ncbi:hypothetical protein GSI_04161 [Ganoderma sinense ZZ0214-1]|uniref:Uncharacterized protein n=1 Tax=Ganoderma sinense ZZ0214-1 TaxID=1077348 RepID=A0A2G8SJ08_9APHY|nr:hypothetical protein GSI_04161 [Ganoderma sinense ZZ0214-1]